MISSVLSMAAVALAPVPGGCLRFRPLFQVAVRGHGRVLPRHYEEGLERQAGESFLFPPQRLLFHWLDQRRVSLSSKQAQSAGWWEEALPGLCGPEASRCGSGSLGLGPSPASQGCADTPQAVSSAVVLLRT